MYIYTEVLYTYMDTRPRRLKVIYCVWFRVVLRSHIIHIIRTGGLIIVSGYMDFGRPCSLFAVQSVYTIFTIIILFRRKTARGRMTNADNYDIIYRYIYIILLCIVM